ncbi:trypsin-1-like [Anoplophora glabripennis]|uniref:trypsin-1-like n=1 Tax=Anoplophora glabripennis TaxID=217634 RepID=UPI000874BB3E|nr:trypsin-1-like [Anoplophora glabripennis]
MKLLLCVLALLGITLAAPNTLLGFSSGRIFGGSDAVWGEFPSIVSLQYCLLGICQHSCGATILSSRWLLTAAHCFTELPAIGSLSVLAGILNQDDANPERQFVSINKYILHPDYEGGVNPHDIALIRLSSALILSSVVQPSRLPRQDSEPAGRAFTAGWGSYGGIILPQMPNTLQRVNVPIVPIEVCDESLTRILQREPHPLHFEGNVCTGPLTEPISVCSGDSGGPLLQDGEVIGVVSWGIVPCGNSQAPSVFVKVSHYVDWISANVDEPLLLN